MHMKRILLCTYLWGSAGRIVETYGWTAFECDVKEMTMRVGVLRISCLLVSVGMAEVWLSIHLLMCVHSKSCQRRIPLNRQDLVAMNLKHIGRDIRGAISQIQTLFNPK